MDIKVKLEPFDTDEEQNDCVESQNENEHQWLPTKLEDEENDYYGEFTMECNENVYSLTIVKSEYTTQSYSIEFKDDNENHSENDDDFDTDYYPESEGNVTNGSDEEDNSGNKYNIEFEPLTKNELVGLDSQESMDEKTSASSNVLYKLELKKWITDNYVNRECPQCSEHLKNYDEFRQHIKTNHKESIEQSETNYDFSSSNCGVCKKCNQEFNVEFTRYMHTIKHSGGAGKLDICICKICNFKSKCFLVQKHFLDMHQDFVKAFKPSGFFRNLKCPLCSNTYLKNSHLWYHFMDKHPYEYKAKLSFNCHLCKVGKFSEENIFLQHLIEMHDLNSWEKLNYRKVFMDKDYIACITCNRLFFKHDSYKLLKHFLEHENNFYWSCNFCGKKIRKSPLAHICYELVDYYEKHCNDKNIDQTYQIHSETKRSIKSLKEFENYVAHVCPFCNKEFVKMLKWQQHLRTDHEIDTLKGLKMKVIDNENNTSKLRCTICHTVVENSPSQLHAHLFQHLPYKPYKCLICSVTLNFFKMAIKHVQNGCNNEVDRNYVKRVVVENVKDQHKDIRSILEIQCSLCNQEFYDVKSVFKHYEDKHNYFEEFFFKHSDNSMTCKICNRKYMQHKTNSTFLHLHNHFDEKTFKCTLCLRTYYSFKGAYYHLLSLHNAKTLNQQISEMNTNKTYVLNNDKESHESNIPQLAKSSTNSHTLNEFAEFISFACPECNESMTSQQNWHSHITTKHNFFDESRLYFKADDGTSKCHVCNITLPTNTLQQQKHKLTHMPYKSFMCNLCYARFNSLGILYGHFRRQHFAQGSFECPICSTILQTAHERTEHLKKIHPRNEWPESMCLICYKVVSTKSNLKKHMTTHDAERFRYTCEICGTKLIALKDFNSHMDRHTTRGEFKDKIGDDVLSQSVSNSSQSSDMNYMKRSRHLEKYKYESPEKQRKKFH